MKQTKLLMGMPVSVEVVDSSVTKADFDKVYDYFTWVDETFSTYKPSSEISKINNGLPKSKWSAAMREVMKLSEETKQQTKGYFDIYKEGKYDPSGLVKGWAINNAAKLLCEMGFRDYYVDAGGDIQVSGYSKKGEKWRVGIRNPFNRQENVKILEVSTEGVATSGAYIRGDHIYNPHRPNDKLKGIASITVIGPNIYEADRFCTAAYAMGQDGIGFIEQLDGFEGYTIADDKIATQTSGLKRYLAQ